jgi:thymidine kinase
MFIEPNIRGDRRGWIEVICGSMFSGKTEELIRRLKRAKIANLKTEIFKPAIDVRYDEIKIVSHDENAIQSTPVDNSQTIMLLAQDVDVVGIDEAQFFDRRSPMFVMSLHFAASG